VGVEVCQPLPVVAKERSKARISADEVG